MRTRAIREALDWIEPVADGEGGRRIIAAARAEVRAIEAGVQQRSTEGLWDIVRELKEHPCSHGNDCRPKVSFMHPCLPCAARLEWEAK